MRQEQTEAQRVSPRLLEASGAPEGDQNKWMALAVVAAGTFMANLDASIVNISLPAIARAFGTTFSGPIEWVVSAYLMVIAGVLLTIGHLADTLGRKPSWVAGLLGFTTGSIPCGAAPSLPLLIGARGLQGLGAACLMAVGPAILTHAFPQAERGRVLGLNAVTVALGISVGPTLGGLITQHFSWRGIFWLMRP
jgi:MFS family permease